MQQDLPIERIRTTLLSSLANCPRVIVTADPGSGKSTILPQFFMTQGKKVVVAQPRRIAARSLAKYVSQSFGEAPGQSIGYRVRHENCTSKTTQLEYVTDGMLVRLLQADPELSEFDVVILDEFHERSTDLDLCLALLMELQSALRPELELILMSATLDTGHLSNWLKAPHLHAPGRPFPNHIERINTPIPRSKLTAEITKYILRTIKDQETKNCLVFLPGVKDIESIHRQLKGRTDIRISQLYGQQKLTAQSQVLATKEQHIILATNIAETSLTIPNVNRVIDSGWRRESRYIRSWSSTALFDSRITKFSARQRAGRASRTGPGKVIQLWTEHEHNGLATEDVPKIMSTNLEQLYVECLQWGSTPTRIQWLTPPPAPALEDAQTTLERLGLLKDGRLTRRSKHRFSASLSPRANLVVNSAQDLNEQDKHRVAQLLPMLEGERLPKDSSGLEAALAHLSMSSNYGKAVLRILKQLNVKDPRPTRLEPVLNQSVCQTLIAGYPERIAQLRSSGGKTYLMSNGCGARPHHTASEPLPPFCLALAIGGAKSSELTLFEFIECKRDWLPIRQSEHLFFSESDAKVVCRRRETFEQLKLAEESASLPDDPQAIASCLADAVLLFPERALSRTPELTQLHARVRLINEHMPDKALPTPLGMPGLSISRSTLLDLCFGHRSFTDLKKINLAAHYLQSLAYSQKQHLETHCPLSLHLSNGHVAKLKYDFELGPILSTRFEWLFGCEETPTILAEPILLELLAPNHRPVQMTKDLKSFWSKTYPEVRKTLRGRYPKHPWPDDPLTAKPGLGRRRKK